MSDLGRWMADLVVLGTATALAAATSAYMYYLQAPSVATVRPELTEVGFWTALFSGRFASWLWLTNPAAATVVVFTIIIGIALAVIWA